MRSEAFAERRSLAFGVREAFARRSRGVREAFGACVRKAGVRKRSKASGGARKRSTTLGSSAISDDLRWPWDDPRPI